jgi:hypothetical protein
LPATGRVHVEVTDENGSVIGSARFPSDNIILEGYKGRYVILYTLNIGLNRADKGQRIDIIADRSISYVKNQPKLKIIPDEKGAYFTDGRGKVILNGVNLCGLRYGDHATFEEGVYNRYTIDTMLRLLSLNGYNCVRAFLSAGRHPLNPGVSGGTEYDSPELYKPYMDNVTDFISRCQNYGIYFMPNFCENEVIGNAYYRKLSGNTDRTEVLFSEKAIEAKKQYIKRFLEYIKNYDESLFNTILALQMQNEFHFSENRPPFNQTTGEYKLYDGMVYDMSDGKQRRSLANRAMQLYYSAMRESVNSVVPGMLLSEGTFTMNAVGKSMSDAKNYGIFPGSSDDRMPMTIPEYLSTDIDFIDMHVYCRVGDDADKVFERNFENMLLDTPEAKEMLKRKLIIMGEFSAFKNGKDTFEEGGRLVLKLRDAALAHGFSGTLMWTIDSFSQTDICHMMEDNGVFLKAMAIKTK